MIGVFTTDNPGEDEETVMLGNNIYHLRKVGVDTDDIDFLNESSFKDCTTVHLKSGDSLMIKRKFDVMFNWLAEIKRKEKWLAFMN